MGTVGQAVPDLRPRVASICKAGLPVIVWIEPVLKF